MKGISKFTVEKSKDSLREVLNSNEFKKIVYNFLEYGGTRNLEKLKTLRETNSPHCTW